MTCQRTRRQFMGDVVTGAFATAGLAAGGHLNAAYAKERITVVEWGGPYIENMKKIADKQDKVDIQWELHAGGSAAILPKIKATWPDKVQFDLVHAWNPVFVAMIREGWAETVTLDDVPHLADIPDALITKDDHGNLKTVPTNLNGIYWAYREDISPIKVQSVDDLFDPRLKGQILFPDPIMSMGLQIVTLAIARGGDERNLEPGWEALKELARSGNIGRLAHSDVEVINSLTSGETSVAFGNPANFATVAAHFPVKHLTKVPGNKGLKTSITTEGWVILKGGKTKAAFEFADFTITPENNEAFSLGIGTIPTNSKAKVADNLKYLTFTEQELAEFAYIPDWPYISDHVDAWQKRWEPEVAPLMQ
jgi:putative spermidine/putrescine transport system substrate-binding protein